MKYRKLGKLGIDVSALGFGAMRLPTNGSEENINEEYAAEMMSYAFDNGVNYVDTAYLYHGGNSETVVGNVLKNGYRDKVYLATKSPTWATDTTKDFDKYLNEQLNKLQVDHIDFYLLHNLHSKVWDKIKNINVLEWGQKAIADGRIKYFGFSIHDSFTVFKDIIDSYEWDFCQIQYNYMNEDVQVGTKGLKYAAAKQIPVTIMEPLLGGTLANFPQQIQKIWDNSEYEPINTAFQWLWNKSEISCVLSGMHSMEQVKQNIQCADSSGINTLKNKDIDFISNIVSEFNKINPIPCTKCKYCLPCPVGIDIPRMLGMYNALKVHEGAQDFLNKALYTKTISAENNAGSCINCKKCESKCPQNISIAEWMPKIHKTLLMEA
jgi:uncharacterized protein